MSKRPPDSGPKVCQYTGLKFDKNSPFFIQNIKMENLLHLNRA